MNVSLNWLATHVDLKGKTPEELDRLLTFAGVEVEGIEVKGVASDKIVVAQIMEAVQHPNADKLKVTQVDAGEGQLRQIVCGAKNYKVGDKVPCCLPGANLGSFTIGETVMRGVESKGMLAAASEIGLTDAEDGLMILPHDFPIGKPVKELFHGDVLLEVEVTPNRPDLLSHHGTVQLRRPGPWRVDTGSEPEVRGVLGRVPQTAPPQDRAIGYELVEPGSRDRLRVQRLVGTYVVEHSRKDERAADVVVGDDQQVVVQRQIGPCVDVARDLAEVAQDPVVGPALERSPEVDADDLAEDPGVHTLVVVGG